MNTKKLGNAERFGRWFGRVWRGYLDCGQALANWLTARGIPTEVAIALLWIVKLAVVAALLYVVFWLVLLFVILYFVARGFANNKSGSYLESSDEWRHGEAGYGLYSPGGQRIDPHNPNDLNDLNNPYS